MARRTESDIIREVCEYLQKRAFFFWRTNNIPVFARSNDGKMRYRSMPKFSVKGVADILILHRGRLIAVEVKKTGTNTKSEVARGQKEFAERIRMNGGKYYIVHSAHEADTIPELQLDYGA